jgi:hypothetical protein
VIFISITKHTKKVEPCKLFNLEVPSDSVLGAEIRGKQVLKGKVVPVLNELSTTP